MLGLSKYVRVEAATAADSPCINMCCCSCCSKGTLAFGSSAMCSCFEYCSTTTAVAVVEPGSCCSCFARLCIIFMIGLAFGLRSTAFRTIMCRRPCLRWARRVQSGLGFGKAGFKTSRGRGGLAAARVVPRIC